MHRHRTVHRITVTVQVIGVNAIIVVTSIVQLLHRTHSHRRATKRSIGPSVKYVRTRKILLITHLQQPIVILVPSTGDIAQHAFIRQNTNLIQPELRIVKMHLITGRIVRSAAMI